MRIACRPSPGPRGPLAVLGGALAVLIALGGTASAQERLDDAQWRRGHHGFTALCRALRLVPVTDPHAWGRLPPNRSLLVVFGDPALAPVNLRGYVAAGGAVLVATDHDEGRTLRDVGLRLQSGPHEADRAEDAFHGYADCPLVSRFDLEHPTTLGVGLVPTNRPAALRVTADIDGAAWQIAARLPPLRARFLSRTVAESGPAFLVASETRGGGRAVVAADDSVFTNQMLFHGDNARLATNALRWLGEGRTAVAIVDEGELIAPPSPRLVMVDVPAPTARDVRAALRELPPELLVEFGNVVAATAEDEGIVNDLIGLLVRDIPRRQYRRWLVLILASVVGLIAVRRIFGGSAADAGRGGGAFGRRLRTARGDRRRAAAELMESFRAEVAGTGGMPWEEFAARLTAAGSAAETRRLRRAILAAGRRLGPEAGRHWSRWRLRRLDEQVRIWQQGIESGAVRYQAAVHTG